MSDPQSLVDVVPVGNGSLLPVAGDSEAAPPAADVSLTAALRARLSKKVADRLKSTAAAIGEDQMQALTDRVNRAVGEVAQQLRAEIEKTRVEMREQTRRDMAEERVHLRQQVMWQWLALAAVVLTAVIKEFVL